jgi:uncharacterized protein (DUF1015 family)
MPQLLPIRGLRYTAEAGSIGDLLAPPYDVISSRQQQVLRDRNPSNAVNLELAEGGEEGYGHVANLLEKWQREGVVRRDEEPMLYVYEQEFVEEGHTYQRRALIAGVEAQPWDAGAVKPHEFTMSGPKEDRLKLLEATKTQFSPVFMIARDRAGQLQQFIDSTVAGGGPVVAGTSIEGDQHRLWPVVAGRYEMRQLAPLLSESFYIADGHHRYETAVTYKKRLQEREEVARDHPARFAMTAIVPASDTGLVIRPIHRMLARQAPADWRNRLEATFFIQHLKPIGGADDQVHEMLLLLQQQPDTVIALGMDPGQIHALQLRDRSVLKSNLPAGRSEEWGAIAPNVLRYGVLEPLWEITDEDLAAGAVEYTHEAGEVVQYVLANPHTAGFLINPVGIESVMSLADQGERMPQKSTFFHPKLGTGLVFHPLYP